MRHQYGIFALVSQTSFRGETSGGVARCRLFSQAIFKLTSWNVGSNLWNVTNHLSCFLAKRSLYLKPKKIVSPESHAAEKRQLVNEIVSLKKMADLHDRDSARRDLQVHQYKSEADKGLTALQDAERKVQNYRVEVRCGFNCFWNSREIGITPLETRILSREKKRLKLKNSFLKTNFKVNLTHGTTKRWKKLRCILCENHGTVTDLDEFARLKVVLLIQTKIIV